MNKHINFLFEWIGPTGPISNTRVPNVIDLAGVQPNCSVDEFAKIEGVPSIFYAVGRPDYFKVTSPSTVNNDMFMYELELSHTRPILSYFQTNTGILDNKSVSPRVLANIRKKKGYLLLSVPYESFLEDAVFDTMINYLQRKHIPLDRVIYLSNCINCKDVFANYCSRKLIQSQLNVEYIGCYMWNIVMGTRNSPFLVDYKYKIELKKKTFLNFNRRWHDHRIIVLLELFRREILDNCFISFTNTHPDNSSNISGYTNHINHKYQLGLTDNDINVIENMLPLVLDTDDFSKFPMETTWESTLKFYDESLINLISETGFFTNIIHLTEKTLKPIAYRQPFIIIGPAGSLQALQNLGFKTFSTVWDEHYDTISSHTDRMKAVLDLITTINLYTDEQKLMLSSQVADIVEYNFLHLINRQAEEIFSFVEKYGTE